MNYFQLLRKLYDIYDTLEGKNVSYKTITNRVKKIIPWSECVIKGRQTLSVTTNQWQVSGLYDPEADEFGNPSIEIEIGFPAKKDYFYFSDIDMSRDHWSEFCIDFAQILGHEFMHVNQFRQRDYRWNRPYKSKQTNLTLKEKQEYYGDRDEIDAYAFTAAAEVIINKIVKKNSKKTMVTNTNLYRTYVQTFDKFDPVVVKFVRLTEKYTKRLERQYHDTTF